MCAPEWGPEGFRAGTVREGHRDSRGSQTGMEVRGGEIHKGGCGYILMLGRAGRVMLCHDVKKKKPLY